ncbi:MAG: SpoIIE family protein phosphatase [Pirellulales bacterium]|nr:SpoIIE family protein phosphatase [Pirellulales bacterium]
MWNIERQIMDDFTLVLDVTQDPLSEDAATESCARTLSLVHCIPDDVAVLDRQGRTIFFNHLPAGRTVDEILGCPYVDFLAVEHRHVFDRACRDALETCRTQEVEVESTTGRWWHCHLVALSEYGEDQHLLIIARDVSERKQVEEILLEREHRYRLLLHAVTSYTYCVQLSHGLPVATAHSPGCFTTTGYSQEDFTSDPYLWINMVHRKDQDKVRRFVERILAGERVSPLEHRIIHRSGAVRWIRNTVVPHYEDGVLMRYDGVVEDISERKAAEMALQAREAGLLAAQRIQSHLLPEAPRTLVGCDIAGASQPADFTGGDYFDYLALSDGSTAFVVGDVSGHGLGPAIVMAMIHAHLRALAKIDHDLSAMVASANRFLIEENETDVFVTVFLGALDPTTRVFRYVNAGHPAGYVLDREGRVKACLESTSFPLGIVADAEFAAGVPRELEPGDLVLLLTDGITEARSPAGEMFGIQRTLSLVRENRELPSDEIVRLLYEAVREFSAGEKLSDDMTSILIKIEPWS